MRPSKKNLKSGGSRDTGGRRQRRSTVAEETFPNWLLLPREVTASILRRLGPVEILSNAQLVCTQWQSITMDPSLWTNIDMRDTDYLWKKLLYLEQTDGAVWHEMQTKAAANRLCWIAIDRCRGGLVELSIMRFVTDELLRHMAASCGGIKRLRLVSCHDATDEGLVEAAAKLPLLEDLELSFVDFGEEGLEAIGRHCPHLTSLKFNSEVCPEYHMEVDEEVLAIAKTMPGLRRLQLLGSSMTNVGLEAMLGGCPHLEYLDLRKCLNLDLTGELGKRCGKRIKDLRLPSDPTDDFEYNYLLQDDYDYNSDSGSSSYKYFGYD